MHGLLTLQLMQLRTN